jgi:hypothetical protein
MPIGLQLVQRFIKWLAFLAKRLKQRHETRPADAGIESRASEIASGMSVA